MTFIINLVDQAVMYLWIIASVLFFVVGLYFTIKTKFVQMRGFKKSIQYLVGYDSTNDDKNSVSPFEAFFASVGGAVGIGNIAGICAAVKYGGPGAIFWVWVTAFLGILLKYNEVYLAMITRRKNKDGSYSGGPMMVFETLFNNKLLAYVQAILLSLYSIEIYQFSIAKQSIVRNWNISAQYEPLVVIVFLVLILLVVRGGVKSVGRVSQYIIPIFVLVFFMMSAYVLIINISKLPVVLYNIIVTAFVPSAALGGVIGVSVGEAVKIGVQRACYAADVGIGYTSIIHSQTSETDPKKQASLTFASIFIDLFGVCTLSMVLVLVGLTPLEIQTISHESYIDFLFNQYFPYMHIFMPIFYCLLGFSTITAFYTVGLSCASYIHHHGRTCFHIIAVCSFLYFSRYESDLSYQIMAIIGALLLIINVISYTVVSNRIDHNL
jgi:alanine or glycine:cation symporter, AGCS family